MKDSSKGQDGISGSRLFFIVKQNIQNLRKTLDPAFFGSSTAHIPNIFQEHFSD